MTDNIIRLDIERIARAPLPPEPRTCATVRSNAEKVAEEIAASAYAALRGVTLGRDAGHDIAFEFAEDVEEMLLTYFESVERDGI